MEEEDAWKLRWRWRRRRCRRWQRRCMIVELIDGLIRQACLTTDTNDDLVIII